MPNCDKLLVRARTSPNSLRFSELCQLAVCYGFVFDRQTGSHHLYKRPQWPNVMNFQDRDGKAVPYQVRQLLKAITAISEQDEEE